VFTDKRDGDFVAEGELAIFFQKPGYTAFALDKATRDGSDATEWYKSMGPQFYIAFQSLAEKGTLRVHLANGGTGIVDEMNVKSSDNIMSPAEWSHPVVLKKSDAAK